VPADSAKHEAANVIEMVDKANLRFIYLISSGIWIVYRSRADAKKSNRLATDILDATGYVVLQCR
jgi:hypothetical protein